MVCPVWAPNLHKVRNYWLLYSAQYRHMFDLVILRVYRTEYDVSSGVGKWMKGIILIYLFVNNNTFDFLIVICVRVDILNVVTNTEVLLFPCLTQQNKTIILEFDDIVRHIMVKNFYHFSFCIYIFSRSWLISPTQYLLLYHQGRLLCQLP